MNRQENRNPAPRENRAESHPTYGRRGENTRGAERTRRVREPLRDPRAPQKAEPSRAPRAPQKAELPRTPRVPQKAELPRAPRAPQKAEPPYRPQRPQRTAPPHGEAPQAVPAAGDKPPVPQKLMGALVATCVVLAVALMAALGMKIFVIRDCQVEGGVHFTRAQIMAAAGLQEGQSIFSVNAGAIRSALQDTPQLQLISVERKLPSQVTLTVKETAPTLVVSYMNQFAMLDEELRVLSVEGSLPEEEYPLVTGMVVRLATPAEKIEVDDALQMEALEAIVGNFSKRSDVAEADTYAAMNYITEIQLADVDNLILYTKNGFKIELGDKSDMDRKAFWVENNVPMFIAKGYTEGTLNVMGVNWPTFIPGQGAAPTTPVAETTPAEAP